MRRRFPSTVTGAQRLVAVAAAAIATAGIAAAPAVAAPAVAHADRPSWAQYVVAPSSRNVKPVRVLATTGDVTHPEGALGHGVATLSRLQPPARPSWPAGTTATASSYHAPNTGNDGRPRTYVPGNAIDGSAEARAGLIAAQVLGLALCRHVLKVPQTGRPRPIHHRGCGRPGDPALSQRAATPLTRIRPSPWPTA